MACLRAATAEWHARAEQHVDLQTLSGTRGDYLRTLSIFYGFYAALEQRLYRGEHLDCGPMFEFEPIRRTLALQRDLAALGLHDTTQLPTCQRLPELNSFAEQIGALYVIEGAGLGGRIISRVVHDRLGIDVETGGAFFAGAGDATGRRWRAFGQAAEVALSDPAARHQAIAAAQEVFTAFADWFAGNAVPHSPECPA